MIFLHNSSFQMALLFISNMIGIPFSKKIDDTRYQFLVKNKIVFIYCFILFKCILCTSCLDLWLVSCKIFALQANRKYIDDQQRLS